MTPPITAPARADSAEIKLAFIVTNCPERIGAKLLASFRKAVNTDCRNYHKYLAAIANMMTQTTKMIGVICIQKGTTFFIT